MANFTSVEDYGVVCFNQTKDQDGDSGSIADEDDISFKEEEEINLSDIEDMDSCVWEDQDREDSRSEISVQNNDFMHDEQSLQPAVNACPVCTDEITGLYYGLFTCSSCKVFFRRMVQCRKKYTCINKSMCPITVERRGACAACRFKKCLSAGMKPESVEPRRTKHDPICLCLDCLDPVKQIEEENEDNIKLMKHQYTLQTSRVPPWLKKGDTQQYIACQTNEAENSNRAISSTMDEIRVHGSHSSEENSNGLDITSTSDTILDFRDNGINIHKDVFDHEEDRVKSMSESSCNAVTSSYPVEYFVEKITRNCPFCDYQTSRSSVLHSHILTKHKRISRKPKSDDDSIPCPHCDFSCSSSGNLKMHIIFKHPKENFLICPHCEYNAGDSDNLRLHIMAEHANVKIYACSYCPYSAFQPEIVTKHIVYNHFKKEPLCPTSVSNRPWKMSNS